jgi:replicative DNA helicase
MKVADKDQNLLIRTLPQNIMAEQMLLGVILTNNESIHKVSDFLLAEHFYEPVHQRIYDAILLFLDKGIVANHITLKNYFDKDEALLEKGGAAYLADLASLAVTIINITDYGRTIYELALRRNLINIGEEVVNDAFDKEIELSAHDQIEVAEQKLYDLAVNDLEQNRGFLQIRHSVTEAINKAQSAFQNKGKVSGISTDFIDLDEILGGFQNSDLLILAGRPSMGKTAMALNLALNCSQVLTRNFEQQKALHPEEYANKKPGAVGFFSLEMSAEQLASRMISMLSGISTVKLRTGHVDEDEFVNIVQAAKDLQGLPFFIDDTPSLTISALRTRARRLKRKHNCAVLFIDYLQLLRSSLGSKEQNRVQEISEITQGLKAIAKELNIPVIALSQLSRAVEQREDKRPLLSDLRESGSIEQDADIVMFIYREEYYLMRKKPKEGTEEYNKWQSDMDAVGNVSEIIISKHRNGPVGSVKLQFDSHLTKFNNYAANYEG